MQSVQSKNGYAMTAAACIWLGLFPLLQAGTYAHITHDKWIIMLILTGVTLLCFLTDMIAVPLIRRIRSRNTQCDIGDAGEASPRRSMVPVILASGLLLWTVLSCFLSPYDPNICLLGEGTRYEGLISQLCYFTLFYLFFFSRVSRKPLLISTAAGVLVFLIIVVLQRAGGNPLGLYPSGRSYSTNPEFQGTIGNIDMNTGYLLIVSGILLYGFCDPFIIPGTSKLSFRLDAKKEWKKLSVAVICLIGLIISIYLIISMDVQFGVIGLAVLFLFSFLRFLPAKWRLPLLILLIVLALLAVWFWPGYGGGLWELHEILHGRTRLSFGSNRIAVWAYCLGFAKEHLFFGGGSGAFRIYFNQYLSDNSLVIPTEQDGLQLPAFFDTAHNEYIAQLTDHGLPAALLFLALILVALFRRREGWFPCLSSCSAAVLCYAVQAFFSFSVCIVAPMFWVVLALSFSEE